MFFYLRLDVDSVPLKIGHRIEIKIEGMRTGIEVHPIQTAFYQSQLAVQLLKVLAAEDVVEPNARGFVIRRDVEFGRMYGNSTRLENFHRIFDEGQPQIDGA